SIQTPATTPAGVASVIAAPEYQTTETLTVPTSAEGQGLSLVFRTGENDWNMLQVIDEDPNRQWNPDEQLLVKQVVDQLTLALQNAQLFKQTERQNRELAVLNEMSRELSAQLNVEQVAETLLKYVSQLMDTASFFIAIYNPEADELSFPLVTVSHKRIQFNPRKVSKGLTDYVIRNRKPLLLNGDVISQMRAMGIEFIAVGNTKPAVSWLGVPLLLGDDILGAIVLQSVTTPYLYSERDQEVLTAIASQTAIAIQNAQLFQQTQQQNLELAILNEMGNELSTLQSVEGVAEIVYRYAGKLMDVTDFFLALYHKENEEMSFPLAYFDGKKLELGRQEVGDGLTGYVIRTRAPLYLPDNVAERTAALGAKTLNLGDEEPALCWLGVPMILGQEILGVISVQSSKQARLYSERQRDLLVAMASQAAIAIQNANLYREEQYRRQVADTLSEMARIAGSSLALEDVVRSLLQQLPKLIKFRTASVQLILPDGRRRQIGGISQDEERQEDLISPPEHFLRPVNEDPIMREIVQKQQPLIISDTYRDPRWEVLPETSHIRSWVGSPLIVGTQVIGILILDDDVPNTYTSEIENVMMAFSAQAAVAIQNANLFEEASQRANEMSILNRIARAISEQPDLRHAFEQIYEDFQKLVPTDALLLALYDEQTNQIRLPVIVDEGKFYEGENSPFNPKSLTGQTILSGKPILFNRPAAEYEAELAKSQAADRLGNESKPSASFIYAPLRVGNKTIGVLSVQSYRLNAYNENSLNLVNNVANQIAAGIENTRLFEQTRQSQEQLSEALRVARMGYFELDLRSETFNFSDDFYAILGATADDFGGNILGLNTAMVKLVYAEDIALVQNAIEKSIESRNTKPTDFEFRMVRLDRSIIWVRMVFKLELDSNSEPRRIAGSIQDINERKLADEALRASEEMQRHRSEYLETATQIGRLITATLDEEVLLTRAVDLIRGGFGFYHVGIYTVDESGYNAILRQATGQAGEAMLAQRLIISVGSRSLIGQATANARPVVSNNTALDPNFRPHPLLPETRAEAVIPLKVGDRLFGALDIHASKVDAFPPEDVAILEILADQISVALDNARSY
ncbi:MAG: GAF domain-containing protein, partial [Anaerolineales bacterium]